MIQLLTTQTYRLPISLSHYHIIRSHICHC